MTTKPNMDDWIWHEQPTVKGWYAVKYCVDIHEGIYPNAFCWENEHWQPPLPVIAFKGPFETGADAINWAYAHDVES